jgi:hypothetical protein
MAVAAVCVVDVGPHCWLSSLSFAGKESPLLGVGLTSCWRIWSVVCWSCAAPLALASVTEIDESLHEFLRQGDVNAFGLSVGLHVVSKREVGPLAT